MDKSNGTKEIIEVNESKKQFSLETTISKESKKKVLIRNTLLTGKEHLQFKLAGKEKRQIFTRPKTKIKIHHNTRFKMK